MRSREDIHDTEQRYEAAKKRLKEDETISEKNKQTIENFYRSVLPKRP
jgi:hypothetical protein